MVRVAAWKARLMAFAQIGPLTGFLEIVAAAVGSGMLLGGFMAGLWGVIRTRPRRQLDRSVLVVGYIGGGSAILLVIVDIIFRYAN